MNQFSCIVSTVYNPLPELVEKARQAAMELGLVFVEREKSSLADLQVNSDAVMALVLGKNGWTLHTPGGELFFHLSMAQLRIKNIISGQGDHMVQAMGLKNGMQVLDCTLGLGSDAVVASFAVGSDGGVCGVESSPFTAFLVKEGLQRLTVKEQDVQQAMRRIVVRQVDAYNFLVSLSDCSYDVVYFDPMFRHPIQESVNLKPLRHVADHRAVQKELLAEAMRVARQRVVLKENSRSLEFSRLGFEKLMGGKYSSVQYGVMEKI